jgi:DUF4097 and DUF4098 domain-containing protein YvlB
VKETIRAANDQDAAKISRQLELAILNRDGHYVLHPDFGLLPNGGDTVRLDIALRVPRGTSADVTTQDGDILISGVQGKQVLSASGGDVHINEVEGSIQVEESGGSADIRGVKGGVEVSGHGGDVQVVDASGQVTVNGEFTGLVRFQQLPQGLQFTSSRTQLTTHNLAGKVEMQMGSLEAANVDGPLEISTSHKDISIAQFRSALTISDEGGNIGLQAGSPPTQPIVVNSKNGDIQLTLPPSSNFVMDASSKKGQVDSDFSSASLVVRSQGEEPSITGSYGKGGPTIHLFTTYGTVHLIRETAIPSQPAPGTTEQTRNGSYWRRSRIQISDEKVSPFV